MTINIYRLLCPICRFETSAHSPNEAIAALQDHGTYTGCRERFMTRLQSAEPVSHTEPTE